MFVIIIVTIDIALISKLQYIIHLMNVCLNIICCWYNSHTMYTSSLYNWVMQLEVFEIASCLFMICQCNGQDSDCWTLLVYWESGGLCISTQWTNPCMYMYTSSTGNAMNSKWLTLKYTLNFSRRSVCLSCSFSSSLMLVKSLGW